MGVVDLMDSDDYAEKFKNELEQKRSKLSYSLLPWELMDEVVQVLQKGAEKYGIENWKLNKRKDYIDAMLRHVSAFMKTEYDDPEDGFSHLSHVICNAFFIRWFHEQEYQE